MSPVARRLLGLFAPFQAQFALSTVLLVIASALPSVTVFLIRGVLDDVLIRHDAGALRVLAPGVVALYALNGGVNVLRAVLTRSIAWRVVTDLRGQLHAHLLTLDIGWHQRTPVGERVSRLNADCNNLQYAVNGVVTAIQKPMTLLGLVASAFYLNPGLALVAICLLPLGAIPIDRFGKWGRRASREALDEAARLSGVAQETMTGVRVVQVFGGEGERQRKFDAVNEAHLSAQVRAVTAQILPGPAVELLAAMGVGGVIWVGGQQVFEGRTQPGELIGFLVAIGLMNDPLKGIALIHSLVQRALAAADSVFGLLDTRAALVDGGTRIAPAPANIMLADVSFNFGDGDVLHTITLSANAGQRVAIVGASGAGKTTLLTLLPRLRDPSAGAILWDGVDLRQYALASVRAQIAVVTQEPFLFDDTIAANIAFGKPGATHDQVVAAAVVANADTFIRDLPQGYDTGIDELGMRLSGGQRQRICIARAVLRGAPVLLLDEATSNLDAESEAAVAEALERLMRGRTTFVVAHRLSTIRDADQIVVLAAGRVVEVGTHDTLVSAGGEYARLVARQA